VASSLYLRCVSRHLLKKKRKTREDRTFERMTTKLASLIKPDQVNMRKEFVASAANEHISLEDFQAEGFHVRA
jgi:hypothetical protein